MPLVIGRTSPVLSILIGSRVACTCMCTAQWHRIPVDRPPRSDLVSDTLDGTDAPPGGLWARMKADPQYAPEHLALEAVRRIGPEAARWAAQVRLDQPGVTTEATADLAV